MKHLQAEVQSKVIFAEPKLLTQDNCYVNVKTIKLPAHHFFY
jgi:hypothetical protein